MKEFWRRLVGWGGAALFLTACLHAAEQSGMGRRIWQEHEPMEVRLRADRVTTLTFPPGSVLESQILGADLVQVQADPERRQLHLSPRVAAGRTNLNVSVDGKVRVFQLIIGPDAGDLALELAPEQGPSGEEALGAVPVLTPEQIPVARILNTLAVADRDPAFAAERTGLFRRAVGLVRRWQDSPVVLTEVAQFVELDLLVLTVAWRNDTQEVLTLPARRVEVTVGGRVVPKTLWVQGSAALLPGQADQMHLFVQGWRLSRDNEFAIELPPEIRRGEAR